MIPTSKSLLAPARPVACDPKSTARRSTGPRARAARRLSSEATSMGGTPRKDTQPHARWRGDGSLLVDPLQVIPSARVDLYPFAFFDEERHVDDGARRQLRGLGRAA